MNEEPPANGSIVIMYPLIDAAGGRTVRGRQTIGR